MCTHQFFACFVRGCHFLELEFKCCYFLPRVLQHHTQHLGETQNSNRQICVLFCASILMVIRQQTGPKYRIVLRQLPRSSWVIKWNVEHLTFGYCTIWAPAFWVEMQQQWRRSGDLICIAWLSLCFILETSWVALYSVVCEWVCQASVSPDQISTFFTILIFLIFFSRFFFAKCLISRCPLTGEKSLGFWFYPPEIGHYFLPFWYIYLIFA